MITEEAAQVVDIPDSSSLTELSISHTVTVYNTGSRTSPVVILAFVVATLDSPPETPLKKLFGFQRFQSIAPGSNKTVTFVNDASNLATVATNGSHQLLPGRYRIEIAKI